MHITCLTSSRADYGILTPLLKLISNDKYFTLNIIAFGSHLSKQNGNTLQEILNNKYYKNIVKLKTLPKSDSIIHNTESISQTSKLFGDFFLDYKTDLVLCLGDRYEMFAACIGILPYGVKIGHISGGEETLGSIDNFYRHSITLMASYHFASSEIYKNRIIEIKGNRNNIFNVGALSIDSLKNIKLLTKNEFNKKYKFTIKPKSILITFHPETIDLDKNLYYVSQLIQALEELNDFQLIFTKTNLDINSNTVWLLLENFINRSSNAILVESFGMIGYYSCMKYCAMLLGNSSSGFVEASFFPKYVINLGNRQKGRIKTNNIKNTIIKKNKILEAVKSFDNFLPNKNINIYGNGLASKKIITILKKIC